jgi:hypothetical protein
MRSPEASSSRNFEGEFTMLRSVTRCVADDSEIPKRLITMTKSDAAAGALGMENFSRKRLYSARFWSSGAGRTRLRRLAYATGKPGTDVRVTEMGRVRR